MHLYIFVVGCLCMSILTSCYEIRETKEKEKKSKIEKMISKQKYDKARTLALKLEYENDKKDVLYRINAAQLGAKMKDGQIEDAEALAKELDAVPVFMDLVVKNMDKFYSNNFRALYSCLVSFPFTTRYHEQLVDISFSDIGFAEDYAAKLARNDDSFSVGYDYFYSTNVGYNYEINKYNVSIMQAFNLALLDKDIDRINLLFSLLKPEAVEVNRVTTKKGDYPRGTITYKLKNRAAEEAIKKAKQVGVKLNTDL